VTDAQERLGQHVKEEAAQELAGPELQLSLLATVGIVFPAEDDVLSIECLRQKHAQSRPAKLTNALIGQPAFRPRL